MNRIKELRKRRGLTQAEVAASLPLGLVNYNKLENGKTALTLSRMQRLAEILDCEPFELISDIRPLRTVHVRAHVEAGSWVESYEWPEDDWYDVAVPDDPHLSGVKLYGAETRGASMNRRYPEGSVVVFTDAIETEEDIEIGKRYIVERERADGLREATVKTLFRDEVGKLWLLPDSTDPRHQAPIQIDGGDDDTIRIIGKVVYSVQRD